MIVYQSPLNQKGKMIPHPQSRLIWELQESSLANSLKKAHKYTGLKDFFTPAVVNTF